MNNRAGEQAEEGPGQSLSGFLQLAGFRYWTACLLPAFVGTTLPFWLRPPGFSFRWIGALEFLIATVLFHAGFSLLLQAHRENRSPPPGAVLTWSRLQRCASLQVAS